jgi:glycosyltransferase involved in cell wall biosynthesis
MISVIIPAYNEQNYLNRTIENIFSTAFYRRKTSVRKELMPEVIVILNGYKQDVDPRAKVIQLEENKGERIAMNEGAKIAKGEYLLRLDGHCTMGADWNIKLEDAIGKCGPKSIVVCPIVPLDKNWCVVGGLYAFCKLMPNMEEKWWTPKPREQWNELEPNMAFTGCGFIISKDFYWEMGGCDESLPPMGAIGPEWAIKAHLFGDGVYTAKDILCGHIFSTGGYNSGGVEDALKMLKDKYGDRYDEIRRKFPMVEIEEKTKAERSAKKTDRTIVVRKQVVHKTTDENGRVLKKVIEHYAYVYTDDGSGPSQEEIEKQYAEKCHKVSEELWLPDPSGELVKVT